MVTATVSSKIAAGSGDTRLAPTLPKNLTKKYHTEVIILENNAFFYRVVGAPRTFSYADNTNYTNYTNKRVASALRYQSS